MSVLELSGIGYPGVGLVRARASEHHPHLGLDLAPCDIPLGHKKQSHAPGTE